MRVGDQVEVIRTGKQGVVRYFGATAFREGTWVGVELFTADGKHDGSVQGVQYFSAPNGHGIFMRPSALMVRQSGATPPPQPPSQPAARARSATVDTGVGLPPAPGEGEERLLSSACRLFGFNNTTSAWFELGAGTLEILQDRSSRAIRKVVIEAGTKRVLLDTPVDGAMDLERSAGSDRAWVFRVLDEAAVEHVRAAQFSSAADADTFYNLHAKCRTVMKKVASAAPKPYAPPNGAAQLKANHPRRRMTIDGDINFQPTAAAPAAPARQAATPYAPAAAAGTSAAAEAGPKRVVGTVASITQKGYAPEISMKPVNQDAKVVARDPRTGAQMFCVFDGHGEVGHKVSSYFERRIAPAVFGHQRFPAQPGVAMREAALDIEQEMLRSRAFNCQLSGTTAVMSVILHGVLYVANIGDSRITVGTRDRSGALKGVAVSDDHKPDTPAEQRRIEAKGGRVFAIDYGDGGESPARVWLKDQNLPGLAMSRSLGDTVAKIAGVISTAELFERKLLPTDEFLVLASDGLFEFMSDQQVCDVIVRLRNPQRAVGELLKISKKLWLQHEPVTDDTTVIIIELN